MEKDCDFSPLQFLPDWIVPVVPNVDYKDVVRSGKLWDRSGLAPASFPTPYEDVSATPTAPSVSRAKAISARAPEEIVQFS